MSNVPTAQLEASRDRIRKLATALISEIHSHDDKSSQTSEAKEKIVLLLKPLISDPLFQKLAGWGEDPTASHEPPSNTQSIKFSLASISQAISDLHKKVTSTHPNNAQKAPSPPKAKTKSNPHPKTYSAAAASRPNIPSVVVSLATLKLAPEDRPRPELVCETLNSKLSAISPTMAKVAAAHWTAKGNLVITGAPPSSLSTLQAAAPHISNIISQAFQLPTSTPLPAARANTKWSKISLNGIPTGASNARGPFTPEECHAALCATNPSYASLTVTQLPSWVRSPTSYTLNSVSSLSIAFEDIDGRKLQALLSERYLYCFGNRATIRKWKQRQPSRNNTTQTQTLNSIPHPSSSIHPTQSPAVPPAASLMATASAPKTRSGHERLPALPTASHQTRGARR